MSDHTPEATRLEEWASVYESWPNPGGDRIPVSYRNVPLLLSDIKAVVAENARLQGVIEAAKVYQRDSDRIIRNQAARLESSPQPNTETTGAGA